MCDSNETAQHTAAQHGRHCTHRDAEVCMRDERMHTHIQELLTTASAPLTTATSEAASAQPHTQQQLDTPSDFDSPAAGAAQDCPCLQHLCHKGGHPALLAVAGTNARKDGVTWRDLGTVCWHEAAHLCHEHQAADLQQVSGSFNQIPTCETVTTTNDAGVQQGQLLAQCSFVTQNTHASPPCQP